MREIKFRAWYPEAKKMHEIGLYQTGECLEYKQNHPKQIEIMQFTGLKDKNGKEIYEGDLLKISMQGDVQQQAFEVENLWDLRIGLENNDSYLRIDSDVEIIGNIYENPELIQERNK